MPSGRPSFLRRVVLTFARTDGRGRHRRRRRRHAPTWRVRCRDACGRGQHLLVGLDVDRGRVVISSADGRLAVLEPLQVGPLRAALRDAVLAVCAPDVDTGPSEQHSRAGRP